VGFILALLAIVAFWMAQQARGLPFAADEISPINATHYFLMAAVASKACGQEPASTNAILPARASSGHLLATMLHGGGVNGVTHSPDGQRILSWSEDGTARLWEAASGAPVGQPMRHEGNVSGAVFSLGRAAHSELESWGRKRRLLSFFLMTTLL
jgi:WD40 repeat protein